MDLKKRLSAGVLVVALAVVGILMNGGHETVKASPGAASVNIVSPLPLPTTGTATVSGTVAATQSGPWNVNVANSPSVNVANPATAPVLVRDVENPAHAPAHVHGTLTINSGSPAGVLTLTSPENPIPAGKRLVLEYASYRCTESSPGGVDVSSVQLETYETFPLGFVAHFSELPVIKGPMTASGDVGFSGSQLVRLYSDPVSQNLLLLVGLTNVASAAVTCNADVSGYLVNVP